MSRPTVFKLIGKKITVPSYKMGAACNGFTILFLLTKIQLLDQQLRWGYNCEYFNPNIQFNSLRQLAHIVPYLGTV